MEMLIRRALAALPDGTAVDAHVARTPTTLGEVLERRCPSAGGASMRR